MMNHVKFTKSFISQKILEIPGNILKAMSLISHGEQPHSLELWVERMLSQEFSSLTTQISKGTKKQGKDGSKVYTFTTQMTSSRLRTTPLMQVTALL
jgi:hypothetical protein